MYRLFCPEIENVELIHLLVFEIFLTNTNKCNDGTGGKVTKITRIHPMVTSKIQSKLNGLSNSLAMNESAD